MCDFDNNNYPQDFQPDFEPKQAYPLDNPRIREREVIFSPAVNNAVASAMNAVKTQYGIAIEPDTVLSAFLNEYLARIAVEVELFGVSTLGVACIGIDADGCPLFGEQHFEMMVQQQREILRGAMGVQPQTVESQKAN